MKKSFSIQNFSTFSLYFILNILLLFNNKELKASVTFNGEIPTNNEKIGVKNTSSKIYKSEYILGPGDILFIKFNGIDLFSKNYPVDLSGNLNLPEINKLFVSGQTIKELEYFLNKEYKEFIFDPDIDIKLTRYRPINITIKGEVNRPGVYTFEGSENENYKVFNFENRKIFNLFKLSKGITGNADISNIKIIRNNSISNGGGKIHSNINILDILDKGDQNQNITLHDEDLIIVPKSNNTILKQILLANKSNLTPDIMTIYINGNVSRPGALEVPQGATLNEALAQAGGALPLTGRIQFLRFKENGDLDKRNLSYSLEHQKNAIQNPLLLEGDIIHVRQNLLGKSTSLLREFGTPLINAAAVYSIFN